jgi:hypothetical protein
LRECCFIYFSNYLLNLYKPKKQGLEMEHKYPLRRNWVFNESSRMSYRALLDEEKKRTGEKAALIRKAGLSELYFPAEDLGIFLLDIPADNLPEGAYRFNSERGVIVEALVSHALEKKVAVAVHQGRTLSACEQVAIFLSQTGRVAYERAEHRSA